MSAVLSFEKIRDFIMDIIGMNQDIAGRGMFMGIYFMCLLVLTFFVKDRNYKKIVTVPALFLIGGVYVGIPFVNDFIRMFFDVYVRPRYGWVLMVPAVIALCLTILVFMIDKRSYRVLAVIFLVPILFFCGDFGIHHGMYSETENAYHLPQCILDMCELALQEKQEPRLIVPYEISHIPRQYSTHIHLLYGENATYGRIQMEYDQTIRHICDEMDSYTPNLKEIHEQYVHYGCDYIVFDSVYHEFGGQNVNVDGYLPDPTYVGDRTPSHEDPDIATIGLLYDDGKPYWNLEEYDMQYVGRFGQYLLYRFVMPWEKETDV